MWNRIDGVLSDRVSVVGSAIGIESSTSVNLTIMNISREDTGIYRCFANNSIGSDNSTVEITVLSK